MPTRENCVQLEGLIEAAISLVDTKKCVDKVEQDIRTTTLRIETANKASEEAEEGVGTPSGMDVDEDADGVEDEDGRAQSVVSSRSTKSLKNRKQVRFTVILVSHNFVSSVSC